MKNKYLLFLFFFSFLFQSFLSAQINLPGLFNSPYFGEQTVTFKYEPEVRIHINAPSQFQFDETKPVGIALFALPNGNTIEQTVGKIMEPGDDWHYDIQHIGAQTRFLREHVEDYNLITVYLETKQLSWPAWKAAHSNHQEIIKKIAEYLLSVYQSYNPFIILTGHSGGGRFTFSFMDAFETLPSYVKRISFLDSNYGYEHFYGDKIADWLQASDENFLSVIAYNDSVALYNGVPIVSPTGGTWYRSRIMKTYLEQFFTFADEEDDDFIKHSALNGRVKFILKKNPAQAILHTVQVERNGFIQGMVSGTDDEGVGYTYYGSRAYSQWIQINVDVPANPLIPPRNPNSKTGSEFMQFVTSMTFAQREAEILKEISAGNIPNFFRDLTEIEALFTDANGTSHTIKYKVMPNYLAIGSDSNFCRIPMGPITAQKLADLFNMNMPTRKLVNNIYQNSLIKLVPVTYAPVGNQNELVPKFIDHNTAIQQQFTNAGGSLGDLTGGTKKDVVLSNLIIDPNRTNHVAIYGWHQLNGQPIQPLTNIHINTYVDYSHGIRFLNSEFLLDNEVKNMEDILKDPILYKILSDETGVMIQPTYITSGTLAPAKPRSFGIRSESSTSLKIIMDPVPDAQSYKIHLSKDGLNFYPPFSTINTEYQVNHLPADSIVYVKIEAVNIHGTSQESEVLAAVPSVIMPQILIVNGFDRNSEGNTFDFIRQHAAAFHSQGHPFQSASNEAIKNGIFSLEDFEIVDYILGDESTADETFDTEEQEIIKSYLKNGGKLFVSGSEIAWDLDSRGSASDKNFFNNFLKSVYIADAPGGTSNTHYQSSPVAGSIFSGIPSFFFDNGTQGTINVKWPDVIKGINGGEACLAYIGFDTSYGAAGIFFEGMFPEGSLEGKLIFIGFPFETIYPEEARNNLMEKVIDFFSISVGVNDDAGIFPEEFKLYQNYPNPFNPVTKIKFSIPSNLYPLTGEARGGLVTLKVYDVLGNEILTLVNEEKSAGNYEVEFDASLLSSGAYFYRLMTNDFVSTKKMILMK
jgi:hypothetical protein